MLKIEFSSNPNRITMSKNQEVFAIVEAPPGADRALMLEGLKMALEFRKHVDMKNMAGELKEHLSSMLPLPREE